MGARERERREGLGAEGGKRRVGKGISEMSEGQVASRGMLEILFYCCNS